MLRLKVNVVNNADAAFVALLRELGQRRKNPPEGSAPAEVLCH